VLNSAVTRRFFKELAAMLGMHINVITVTGKQYVGKFEGYDDKSLSLCLSDVKDNEGKTYHKVFIYGHNIAEIIEIEQPFDFKALAERLEKVFPQKGAVKVLEEAGMILVFNKIKVTEKGVEGEGPLAERVKRIYDEFVEETKK